MLMEPGVWEGKLYYLLGMAEVDLPFWDGNHIPPRERCSPSQGEVLPLPGYSLARLKCEVTTQARDPIPLTRKEWFSLSGLLL